MFSLPIYGQGLAIVCVAGFCTWILSLYTRNVAIVDSLWSVMFLLLALTTAISANHWGPRALLVVCLTGVWALRLSIYIGWRSYMGWRNTLI